MMNLYRNPVMANLAFLLVLAVGALSYSNLPREENPTVQFNWVEITTLYPGASADQVEQKVTRPLELAAAGVGDIKFITSTSRESVSIILVRFDTDLDEGLFSKRLADLRQKIDQERNDLPQTAEDPQISEITTANAFPIATLALVGDKGPQNLHAKAKELETELERIDGVDDVTPVGYREPELRILFDPDRIARLGISPASITRALESQLRDVAAGRVQVNNQDWLLQFEGSTTDITRLSQLSLLDRQRQLKLGDIATVVEDRADPQQIVRVDGKPAVMLSITKQADSNTLDLVDSIKSFVIEQERMLESANLDLVLIDDQTNTTRQALSIMENNAAVGLILVVFVGWLFLGFRTAFFTAIGIPFILAATLVVVDLLGQSLNIIVLLGMVIALGMLVDNSVVVVEGFQRKYRDNVSPQIASFESVSEVAPALTAAVLTTIAAFLPLMLLPGILGQFMFVAPLVVTAALLMSLVQAFWILPTQVATYPPSPMSVTTWDRLRNSALLKLRRSYGRCLAKVLRARLLGAVSVIVLVLGAVAVLTTDLIRKDFFASDPYRLFYVNVDLPTGTPLEETMAVVSQLDAQLRTEINENELRSLIGYAGQQFTETSPLFDDNLGQLLVTLYPDADGSQSVDDLIDAVRPRLFDALGRENVSFQKLRNGPPTSKPISVKIRGEDFDRMQEVADRLRKAMTEEAGFIDVTDDFRPGLNSLRFRIDGEAARRIGIEPLAVAQTLRLLADGVVVASVQESQEKVDIRVIANRGEYRDASQLLSKRIADQQGRLVPLSTLVDTETTPGRSAIRHYNLKRAISLEADINETKLDTLAANQLVRDHWLTFADDYPSITLDFTGAQEDIQESLASLAILFPLGLGAIYLILGAQFRSYWQPLVVLMTVPLAFVGVVIGLIVTGNPLSLYTLYGIVALAGIAVNSAIVMVDAANRRVAKGMLPVHAIIFAARERIVPILITSLTTIAGLFSLAAGLAGSSLTWGPLATAIVWGIGFSTALNLFVIPQFYLLVSPKPNSST